MKNPIVSFLDSHEAEERKVFANPRHESAEDGDDDEASEIPHDERAAYGGKYDDLVNSGLHPNLAAQLSRMTPRQQVGWAGF